MPDPIKISNLTALSGLPTTDDLFVIVDDPSGSAATKKVTAGSLAQAIKNLPNAAATELTLSTGEITVTQSVHKLQPETGTTDDLDTISGMSEGEVVIIYISDAGTDIITFKHGTGNISCVGGTDIDLSEGAVIGYSNGTTVFIAGGGGGSETVNPSICQGRLGIKTGEPTALSDTLTVTAATNASPIVVTAAGHGFSNGNIVRLNGFTVNTNANGEWTVANVTTDTFELSGSTGNGVEVFSSAQQKVFKLYSTLYFTPNKGNLLALYNTGSSAWEYHTLTEISANLLTANGGGALTANTPFDVFVYDNSGTLTLNFVTWTDATNRATELAMQDGVYVKTGAANYRYLGSVCPGTNAGYVELSIRRIGIFNACEDMRIDIGMDAYYRQPTVTYSTASTWRLYNNDSTNTKLEIMCGLPIKLDSRISANLKADADGRQAQSFASNINTGSGSPTWNLTFIGNANDQYIITSDTNKNAFDEGLRTIYNMQIVYTGACTWVNSAISAFVEV